MSGKGLNALFAGTGVLPSILVMITLWEISGSVYSGSVQMQLRRNTDTRAGIIGDSLFIQDIHLLTDRTIDTWIAGVETNGHLTLSLCSLHNRDHFLKGHLCTVMDGAHPWNTQKLGIYKEIPHR